MSLLITRCGGPWAAIFCIFTLGLIGLDGLGLVASSPTITAVAAFALLVFGLPHGAFDLALLRATGKSNSRAVSSIATISLYLGCAAAMYLIWCIGPVFALVSFLVLSVVHFAEDWEACGSRFIAVGIAAAILSAPSFRHGDDLRTLFVSLTGNAGAAVVADVMLLVAPTYAAVALVGLGLLWRNGQAAWAVGLASSLAAMLWLPPVIGFALFFCLVHSPRQFRDHADRLGLSGFKQWGGEVVPLSLGGLGVALVVFALNSTVSFVPNVVATSFMTLSILTVPHMIVPMIIGLRTPSRLAHA